MRHMTALMIDGADTLDRDDAVTVTQNEDGWDATVYVAAVADAVPFGSPADRAALSRVQTLYLRSEVKPMLGRELEDAATLSATQDRPVVAISMRFTKDGDLISSSITRDLLPAGTALAYTHAQVGAALAQGSDDPQRGQLHAAYRLARTLIAGRRAAGAFAIFDATRGLVTSEEGRLVALQSGQVPSAYLIVQELMVAANSTLARWAIDHELPILFRNHVRSAVAPPADDLLAEVNAELAANTVIGPDALQALTTRTNQTLRPATYQPVAVGHFGLQIPAYTHATAPLRRYADLVTQRQVLAHIDGTQPPYSPAVLDTVAEAINTTIRELAEQKSAAASAARRKHAATAIAASDYSRAVGRDWLRILRIAASTAVPDGLAAEVNRRADAGEVDGAQLAEMMRATGTGWPSLLEQVIAAAQQATPQEAASAISVWNQANETPWPAPEVEYQQSGPPHAPTFTARVTFAGVTSSWTVGASKKLAERQALWELVEIIAGVQEATDPASPPPEAGAAPTRQASGPAVPEVAPPVDLAALAGKEWLRTARALISDPAGREGDLADELAQRAEAGTLEAPVVAALLAEDSGRWRALLAELTATMRTTAPHVANSALSAWQQLQGAATGTPQMEVRQFGEPHAPVFAIRAQHEQWLTIWRSGAAKKATSQQVLWDLVDVIAGNAPPGGPDDEPDPPPVAAEDPAPAESAHLNAGTGRAIVPAPAPAATGPLPSSPAEVTATARPLKPTGAPAAVLANPALTAALGGTPTERARKYRNAAKSPAAWINNLAATLGSGTPEADIAQIEGGFTATITLSTPVGELTDSGSGTNQKTARAVASLALVQRLFAITDGT